MFKKTLACFISALIILLPLESYAEELEGRVTSLSLNEEAPYAGVLLDPIAASKMIVEHDSLQKIHKEITLLKDQQVSDLNLLLKEEMGNDYTEWWVMGGVVIGIFLSVAVFYASVEVVK